MRNNRNDPTPWAVYCLGDSVPDAPSCGLVFLQQENYVSQLYKPDNTWFCPNCGSTALWDDECQATNPPVDEAMSSYENEDTHHDYARLDAIRRANKQAERMINEKAGQSSNPPDEINIHMADGQKVFVRHGNTRLCLIGTENGIRIDAEASAREQKEHDQ